MFGIGLTEFIVILVVALIAIGPDKLPAMAKALGKVYSEFRKAGEEVKKSFMEPEETTGKKGPQGPEKASEDPDKKVG